MAQARDRVIALTLAVVFFLTSAGVGLLVVWQAMQDDNQGASMNNQTTIQGTQLADFTPLESVNELMTYDTKLGDGEEVMPGDTVTVDYTGAVAATGIIFQSSLDAGTPVTFPLSGVIVGWQEGMPGMKVGGQRRIIIPAEKAYGPNPPAGSAIPPDAALVFDVTLISIETDVDEAQ